MLNNAYGKKKNLFNYCKRALSVNHNSFLVYFYLHIVKQSKTLCTYTRIGTRSQQAPHHILVST